MNSGPKTAVITGGAGGLGRALAAMLIADGWHAVLIDLPGEALNAAARDFGDNCTTLGCDLTDDGAVEQVCTSILSARPSIHLVIYNAGVTQIAEFKETNIAQQRRVMEINHFGAVGVAGHLLEAVRKAGGSHLAISSVAGHAPLIRRTAYAASKHAMEGFFKSLAAEEAAHGVSVTIAAPSFIATNTGRPDVDNGGLSRPGSASDGMDEMSPQAAAQEILRGWRKGRPYVPVGRVARLGWRINRLSPTLYAWLMRRQMNRKR